MALFLKLYSVGRLYNLLVCETCTEILALISCLALGKILNVPRLQFSHQEDRSLTGLGGGVGRTLKDIPGTIGKLWTVFQIILFH